MQKRKGWMGARLFGRLLMAAVAVSLSATGVAATRSGATTVAVRVERHTGLFLPATDPGFRLASLTEERLPVKPQAFGNSHPSLLASGESPKTCSRASSRREAPRVVLTAFEP